MNTNEYNELAEEFNQKDLLLAYKAMTNDVLREELYEFESPLLVFFLDSQKQTLLYEYIESLRGEDLPDYIDGC